MVFRACLFSIVRKSKNYVEEISPQNVTQMGTNKKDLAMDKMDEDSIISLATVQFCDLSKTTFTQ